VTLDTSKPICTRDGRPAKILSIGHISSITPQEYSYPIRAEVEHPNDRTKKLTWCFMINGQYKSSDPCNHNDLVNQKVWHEWLYAVKHSRMVQPVRRS
jgi:hypothetical protein